MAFGLRPHNAGAIGSPKGQWYPVADAYAGNIFSGDFVEILVGGTVQRQETTTGLSPVAANPTLGVAVGFKWTDAQGQSQWGSYYPGGAGTSDIEVHVQTSPDALFVIECDGPTTFADVGKNAPVLGYAASAGNTTSGNSGIYLDDSSIAETADLALQLVEIIKDGSNEFKSTGVLAVVRIRPTCLQLELGDYIP